MIYSRYLLSIAFVGLIFLSGCTVNLTMWTITVNNVSVSENICFVRISSSSASSWGDDELGSSEIISPGDSRSFNEFEGLVDLKIEGCDGTITQNFEIRLDEDLSFDWVGL